MELEFHEFTVVMGDGNCGHSNRSRRVTDLSTYY
jgi:hypothetical protein